MPAYDGGSFDEEDICPPIIPDGAQPGPQKSIRRGEPRPLYRSVKNAELMAERQDFKLQSCAAPQRGGNRRIKGREYGAEREAREEREAPIYQSDRHLREPQTFESSKQPLRMPVSSSSRSPKRRIGS
jgi:hypothetical protein